MKKYLLLCALAGLLHTNVYAQSASVTAYAVQDVTSRSGFFDAQYTFKRTFAANDPNFPNKTDYVKRSISIPKTGNPLNWVKNNALTLSVTAAVAAAGYAIDELTNQVSTVSYIEPEGYISGRYWARLASNPQKGATPQEYVDLHNAANVGGSQYILGPQRSTYEYWLHLQSATTGAITYNWSPVYAILCSGSTGPHCQAPQPTESVQPVPEADVWALLEPVFQQNPNLLTDSLTDPVGNPYYFQPVADAADSIGTGVSGYTNYSGTVVSEPVGDAPEVGLDTPPTADIDIPTDYARETTTQSIVDGVTDLVNFFDSSGVQDQVVNPDVDYLDSIFNPVETDLNSVSDPTGDPTSLMPSLPSYSATCQTLSYPMMGSTFTFPSASQCDKLNVGKTIIGWMLYLLTAYMIINLFLSRTGRAVR